LDSGGSRYGDSECGVCVAEACRTERDACAAEPSCAASLSCLEGCDVGATGNVAPDCRAGCPRPADAASRLAFEGFEECRGGAACPACGTGGAGGDSGAGGRDGGGGAEGQAVAHILDQRCAPSNLVNPCLRCFAERCCKTEAAYRANPESEPLDDCLRDCDDAPCLSACLERWPGAVDVVLSSNACGIRCGTDDTCLPGGPSELFQCMVDNCAAAKTACDIDPSCYVLSQCSVDCLDAPSPADCFDACEARATPEALDKRSQYDLCLSARCP
jgi:hypothetical protein